ncbi:hypothetical protein NliqN6_0101 [Naganishia liquefaciens]|uniref:Uncharacterized protein n=1 Tax=Naganishia liquefaciens TaxID=104408 RepID=A0A8H3TMS3_9TREE|nr:hypothetical protein NliqN6_0101 [Naganishia liquefaciens]
MPRSRRDHPGRRDPEPNPVEWVVVMLTRGLYALFDGLDQLLGGQGGHQRGPESLMGAVGFLVCKLSPLDARGRTRHGWTARSDLLAQIAEHNPSLADVFSGPIDPRIPNHGAVVCGSRFLKFSAGLFFVNYLYRTLGLYLAELFAFYYLFYATKTEASQRNDTIRLQHLRIFILYTAGLLLDQCSSLPQNVTNLWPYWLIIITTTRFGRFERPVAHEALIWIDSATTLAPRILSKSSERSSRRSRKNDCHRSIISYQGILGLVSSKDSTRLDADMERHRLSRIQAPLKAQLANKLCFWAIWHAVFLVENFPLLGFVASRAGAKYLLVKTFVMMLCLNWYLPPSQDTPPMGLAQMIIGFIMHGF